MTLKATAVKPYQFKNSPRMLIINYFSKRTYSIKHVYMRMHALGEHQEEFFYSHILTQKIGDGYHKADNQDRLWASIPLNRAKGLAQRYSNKHLSSAIATASLPILNLQIQEISPYMKDMDLNYLAQFRLAPRLRYFQWFADLDETHLYQ